MRTRHDPRFYHANRRVVCSTGFILGQRPPLKPVKDYDAPPEVFGFRGRNVAQLEKYRAAARRGWEKRRVRDG